MSDTHGGGLHLTTKGYVTGFILAIILTLVSFGMILYKDSVSETVLYTVLFLAMTVQMLVHIHYFLHLNTSKEQRWNVIAIGFTAILLFIFIAGTMWVMYTLNSRMM